MEPYGAQSWNRLGTGHGGTEASISIVDVNPEESKVVHVQQQNYLYILFIHIFETIICYTATKAYM